MKPIQEQDGAALPRQVRRPLAGKQRCEATHYTRDCALRQMRRAQQQLQRRTGTSPFSTQATPEREPTVRGLVAVT